MISNQFLSFFNCCNLYKHTLWRNKYLFIDYQNVIYSHINYFTAGSEKNKWNKWYNKTQLIILFYFVEMMLIPYLNAKSWMILNSIDAMYYYRGVLILSLRVLNIQQYFNTNNTKIRCSICEIVDWTYFNRAHELST